MRYRILGPLTVAQGESWVEISAAKPRATLALLLVRANQSVSADWLIEELWGGDAPRTARNVLLTYLTGLRTVLASSGAAHALIRDTAGYRMRIDAGDLDLHHHDEALAGAVAAAARGDHALAANLAEQALALWRGAPLADVSLMPTIAAEVDRLNERRARVQIVRVRAGIALGQAGELVPEIADLVAARPLDEELRRLLILAQYRSGQVAEALTSYRDARALLRTELGIEPGDRLRELERAILNREEIPDEPTDAVPVIVADAAAVPLPVPAQLPPDVPDFVGRADLRTQVTRLLSDHDATSAPVVVVSGEPGVGKTAFALHVAHRVRGQFPDGHVYVDFDTGPARRADPAVLLGELLGTLGLTAAPGQSLAQRSAIWRSWTSGRRVLLVVDNALEEGQVRPLLPADPNCAVLVTAPHPLVGLIGTAVPLPRLHHDEAIEMIARIIGSDRVAAEPAEATRIVELCDGLPLALRIAGARLAGRQHRRLRWLADRLADERHGLDELVAGDLAMRRSLDLSYHALDPADRAALRALALPAVPDLPVWFAAALLDCPIPAAEEMLERLAEVHLAELVPVSTGWPRYRMHQLIRRHAVERAVAEDAERTRNDMLDRAFGCTLHLAEVADSSLSRSFPRLGRSGASRYHLDVAGANLIDDPDAWFDAERVLLVAVIHQCVATGRRDHAWDLATTLERYFESGGHAHDWRSTHEAALSVVRGVDVRAEACLLRGLGELCGIEDRYEEALDHLVRAVRLFEELGDERAAAHASRGASVVYRVLGRYDEAAAAAHRALAVLEAEQDRPGLAETWYSVAAIQRSMGQPTEALASFGQALHRFQEIGDQFNQSLVLCSIGLLHSQFGRVDEAEQALAASRDRAPSGDNQVPRAYALTYLGEVYTRTARPVEALAALDEALAVFKRSGDRLGAAITHRHLGLFHQHDGTGAAVEFFTTALDDFREMGVPIWIGRTLINLGDAIVTEDRETAVQHWREAAEILDVLDAAEAADAHNRLDQDRS